MEGATPVALIATQQVVAVPAGAMTYSNVAASDTAAWEPGLACIVKNGSGTQDVVTVVVPGNGPGGVALADPTVTVPITTGERWIFLGDPAYADPTTSLVTLQHSQTTTVTCAFFRVR